jgi:hypothetical protein
VPDRDRDLDSGRTAAAATSRNESERKESTVPLIEVKLYDHRVTDESARR